MSRIPSSLSFFWGNTLIQIHRDDYWYIQTTLTQSIIINNVDVMFRKWRHRDIKTSERLWRESCGWQGAEEVMWSGTEAFLWVAFVILVKDLLFLPVCKKVPLFLSLCLLRHVTTIWTVCFVSKWVFLFFLFGAMLGHSGSRKRTRCCGEVVSVLYRLLTTCHLGACGDLDRNLISNSSSV